MKKLVVYVNKADMVDDPEMLELVKCHYYCISGRSLHNIKHIP